MAQGLKGNKIKAKRIGDMQKVLNNLPHPAAAAKYNPSGFSLRMARKFTCFLQMLKLRRRLQGPKRIQKIAQPYLFLEISLIDFCTSNF